MKMIIVLLSGSLLLTAVSSTANAQYFTSNRAISESNIPAPGKSGTTLSANEVNSKALNDFNKKYQSSSDAEWALNGRQYTVYFTKDDIKMRSVYNKKGRWEYTIAYYNESKLPGNVSDLVKGAYNNMGITLVIEVQLHNKIAYFVKMEDSKSYLTVKVVDGEMEIHERLEKI